MMTAPAIAIMAGGLFGVLGSVAIVTTGGTGRFPLDPLLSLLVGFGLILLGQVLVPG